jgi:hypothetical protein
MARRPSSSPSSIGCLQPVVRHPFVACAISDSGSESGLSCASSGCASASLMLIQATFSPCSQPCRRSELCALQVGDVSEAPDGLRVLIRRSKGDQEGQGQEVERSRFPEAIASARSRRCKRGSPQPRSAPGRCSGPWPSAARCQPWRWQTTARRGL